METDVTPLNGCHRHGLWHRHGRVVHNERASASAGPGTLSKHPCRSSAVQCALRPDETTDRTPATIQPRKLVALKSANKTSVAKPAIRKNRSEIRFWACGHPECRRRFSLTVFPRWTRWRTIQSPPDRRKMDQHARAALRVRLSVQIFGMIAGRLERCFDF